MLKAFIIICGYLCLLTNICRAQHDTFILSITDLPSQDNWNRDTVDAQGKSTGYSGGTTDELYTLSPSIAENFTAVKKAGDTTFFTGSRSRMTVVFDNSLQLFRKIQYDYNNSYPDPGPQVLYSFSAANVTAADEDSVFTADLSGSDVLGHALNFHSFISWGPIDGPGIYSSDDIVSQNTSDLNTHIHFEISRQHLLAVKQRQRGSIMIFPNPAAGELRIELPDRSKQQRSYELVDLLGVVRKKGMTISNSFTVDVSNLGQGNYYLRIGEAGRMPVTKQVAILR